MGERALRLLADLWWEVIFWQGGRVACRLAGRHNVTCRGRRDHQWKAGHD